MSATSQILPGIRGGAYRNSATYASPTWVIMPLVRDATPQWVWDFVEASVRATSAKLYAKSQVDVGGSLVLRADPADAAYLALIDASASRTSVLDLLLLDALITVEGSHGIRGEFLVGAEPQDQSIGGVIYTTFQLKPTYTANGFPGYVVMGAASAPTITSF